MKGLNTTTLYKVVALTCRGSKHAILTLALTSMLTVPIAAFNVSHANWLNDKMQQLAIGMGNTTSPAAYSTTSRHLLSGGSVYAHTKIFNETLISFTPPNISGGCGGINMFFGAFSFISAQELIQLFRAVAANAAPLLFMMALQAIDPQLAHVIESFQTLIRKLNDMLSDSCRLAQGIVNDTADAIGLNKEYRAGTYSLSQDAKSAWDSLFPEDESPLKTAQKIDKDESKRQGFYGNLIYHALTRDKVKTMFGTGAGTSAQIAQQLMSITGTIITTPTKDSGQAASASTTNGTNAISQTVDLNEVGPTLTLASFVDEASGLTSKGKGSSVGSKILKCDDETDCLKPEPATWDRGSSVPDFKTYVEKMLCGSSTASCDDGAILSLATNGEKRGLTDSEKSFMASMPGGIGAYLNRMAALSVGSSGTTGGPAEFVRQTSGAIATEMAIDMLHQAISTVWNSLAAVKSADKKTAYEMIARAKHNIDTDAVGLRAKYGNLADIQDKASKIMELMMSANTSAMLNQSISRD